MTSKTSSKQSANQTAKPRASTKEKEKTTMPKFTSNDSMLALQGYGVLNPGNCTEAELKIYKKVADLIIDNPVTLSTFSSLFEAQIGYSFMVTLGDLLDSYKYEEFSQYNIIAKNVLNILASPSDGLLTGHQLSRHIEVGYFSDNIDANKNIIDRSKFAIVGGRNRSCAILTELCLSLLFLEGHDPRELIDGTVPVEKFAEASLKVLAREDVKALKIPVQPVEYSLQYIYRSNQSRTMRTDEKNIIGLQMEGIDINLESIASAIIDKKTTAANGWAAMFAYLSDKDSKVEMTVATADKIGRGVYANLKKDKFTFPLKSANLVLLVNGLWAELPHEVDRLQKDGITNIARDGVAFLKARLTNYAKDNAENFWDIESEQQQVLEEKLRQKQEAWLAKQQAKQPTKTKKSPKAQASTSKSKNQASPDPDVTTQEYVNPPAEALTSPVEAVAEEELVTA